MDPQLIAYLDTRFGQIASSFESFDTRFGQLEARFGQIEVGLGQLENRFGQLETRFDQLEARFGKLETRFDQLETRMGQLEIRVGQLEHRMGQLEHRVGQLEDRVGQQGLRLDRLEKTGRHTLVMVEGLRDEVRLMAEAFVGLDERVQRMQKENGAVYEQVRSWIEPAFRGMDGRVQVLEGRSDDRHLDVLDAVRKMLARKPLAAPVASE